MSGSLAPKKLYHELNPTGDGPYVKGGWRMVPEIVQNEKEIHGFFGEYRFLSNFGKAKVFLDGAEYDSVEIAYQAAKWCIEDRGYFSDCTNEESFVFNRNNQPNLYSAEEWELIKLSVMKELIDWKFNPFKYGADQEVPEVTITNCRRLIETGDADLVETNWWGDTFWGQSLDGSGENNLGKILMSVRANILESMSC